MSNENILVSVCINTYNRRDSLESTIRSIQNQTHQNIEIIIVDDCSTDNTKEFIENDILLSDKRFRYIRHDHNKGLASGRNSAIYASNGKYFTFCDDDDLWKKDLVENFLNVAEKYNDNYLFCSMVISDFESFLAIESSLKNFMISGYTPPVGSQFYFTSTLKNIGGYNENIKSGVDHDLWFNLASCNQKLVYLNKELSMPNQVFSDKRITQNVYRRLKYMNFSITIWRNKYRKIFEQDYFNFLERNYKYNSHKKFIKHSLKEFSLNGFITHLFKIPKDLFFKDIVRFIKKRTSKIFFIKLKVHYPAFFPYKIKHNNSKLKRIYKI